MGGRGWQDRCKLPCRPEVARLRRANSLTDRDAGVVPQKERPRKSAIRVQLLADEKRGLALVLLRPHPGLVLRGSNMAAARARASHSENCSSLLDTLGCGRRSRWRAPPQLDQLDGSNSTCLLSSPPSPPRSKYPP
eukprot:3312707-Rhodomonas_salina.1